MRQETYYLTIVSPAKGERVMVSVQTADRLLSEKLLGCGAFNKKGFGFRGLYTEEEVRHLFRPGTDVTGSMDIVTGQFLQHKDYKKVPALFMEAGRLYRMKNQEKLFLALSKDQCDFDYVLSVLSGKVAPEAVRPMVSKQSSQAKPVVAAPVSKPAEPTLDSYKSFLEQMDHPVEEPELSDALSILDADDFGDLEFSDPDETELSDAYKILEQPRKAVNKADQDYVPDADSLFYEAQKTVVSSEVDFQTPGELQDKLQERFRTRVGQPIRKQGQSLKELFSGSVSFGK